MSRSLIFAAVAIVGILQTYGSTLTLTILDEIYERENKAYGSPIPWMKTYKTCHPTGTLEGAEAFGIEEESDWGTKQWEGYSAVENFQDELRDLWDEGNVIQVTYTPQGGDPQVYDIADTYSVTIKGDKKQVAGSELSADLYIDTDCDDWNLLGSIIDAFKKKSVVQFVLKEYYQEKYSGGISFKTVEAVDIKLIPGDTISITTSNVD
eukprot:CAMPEP_0202686582 /NCGR_PEP_ID=MMETSP1385-20130828/2337_1 /ASSEMBLY_ACC=CAM_ASM_000861 /TAXON_ID=933848 /ORGANISM="Elphidium margaritaceum" /LENGTH=207 /DNA_ID=CAMNT_0049341187 /DNA_START=29 /DNA_END=652 /DNA_ORIENTATION=+